MCQKPSSNFFFFWVLPIPIEKDHFDYPICLRSKKDSSASVQHSILMPRTVTAKFDFAAEEADELSFRAGDSISVFDGTVVAFFVNFFIFIFGRVEGHQRRCQWLPRQHVGVLRVSLGAFCPKYGRFAIRATKTYSVKVVVVSDHAFRAAALQADCACSSRPALTPLHTPPRACCNFRVQRGVVEGGVQRPVWKLSFGLRKQVCRRWRRRRRRRLQRWWRRRRRVLHEHRRWQ